MTGIDVPASKFCPCAQRVKRNGSEPLFNCGLQDPPGALMNIVMAIGFLIIIGIAGLLALMSHWYSKCK